jgi:hypothetical protein
MLDSDQFLSRWADGLNEVREKLNPGMLVCDAGLFVLYSIFKATIVTTAGRRRSDLVNFPVLLTNAATRNPCQSRNISQQDQSP